jgi:hypothetical protein
VILPSSLLLPPPPPSSNSLSKNQSINYQLFDQLDGNRSGDSHGNGGGDPEDEPLLKFKAGKMELKALQEPSDADSSSSTSSNKQMEYTLRSSRNWQLDHSHQGILSASGPQVLLIEVFGIFKGAVVYIGLPA